MPLHCMKTGNLFLSIFRYGISFKTISGESNSVTDEMTAPWNETTLPTILSRYPLENIFNADEFGLFYNCLPDKTYHFKKEKCNGGKHSKVRLTGMAAGNAKGERLQMFTIGKSKNPRCFKGVKSLPCRYRSQQKSWMSSEIFEEWVKEIDRSFGKRKRKIALIVDNCPAHPHVEKLEWVELIFLPPNTTSMTQPMDQGVIRLLKAKYRKLAVQKHLEQLDKGNGLLKFSILTAMTMLNKAWNAIPDQTFENCFKKSGISDGSVEKALNDSDDPFQSLDVEVEENTISAIQSDLQKLSEKFNVNVDITADELVDLDSDVTVSGVLSDTDIINDVTGCVEIEDDEADNEDVPEEDIRLSKPSYAEVVKAISIVESYSVFTTFGGDLRKALCDVTRIVERAHIANTKQSNIDQFFQ